MKIYAASKACKCTSCSKFADRGAQKRAARFQAAREIDRQLSVHNDRSDENWRTRSWSQIRQEDDSY